VETDIQYFFGPVLIFSISDTDAHQVAIGYFI